MQRTMPWLLGAIFCAGAAAAAPVWVPVGDAAAFWAARLLVALAAAIVILRRSGTETGRPPLAASPVVLLPVMALLLYSVVPAAVLSPFHEILPLDPQAPPASLRWMRPGIFTVPSFALGSEGERAVLSFAGVGVLATLALDRLWPAAAADALQIDRRWGLVLVLGGGAGVQVAQFSGVAGLAASVADALPAVVMLGMVLTVWPLISRQQRPGWIEATAVVGACVLLAPHQMKTFVLGLGGVLFAAFVMAGWRRRVALTCLVVLVSLSAPLAINALRYATFFDSVAVNSLETMRWKVVLRQTETVFCLAVALRDGGKAELRDPWYFAAAVVPRAFWPGKPNLSNGEGYGQRYCGVPPATPGTPVHSASVTLLGEPWIEAGRPGLTAASLLLVAIATGLAWAWKRGPTLAVAIVLALSPWIIDFDQHFAMWVGNLAKAALAMVATAVFLVLVGRINRSHPS